MKDCYNCLHRKNTCYTNMPYCSKYVWQYSFLAWGISAISALAGIAWYVIY